MGTLQENDKTLGAAESGAAVPAHNDAYITIKQDYDKMLADNNPVTLAMFELVRRIYKTSPIEFVSREFDGNFCYTLRSPLISQPFVIRELNDSLYVNASVGDSVKISFDRNSLAGRRLMNIVQVADKILGPFDFDKWVMDQKAIKSQRKAVLLRALMEARIKQRMLKSQR